jgi:hypothetical protein
MSKEGSISTTPGPPKTDHTEHTPEATHTTDTESPLREKEHGSAPSADASTNPKTNEGSDTATHGHTAAPDGKE